MTNDEWLTCADPREMLNYLLVDPRCPESPYVKGVREGRGVTDRKLRLWASSCVRIVLPALSTSQSNILQVTEKHADGLRTDEDLYFVLSQDNTSAQPHQIKTVLHQCAANSSWGGSFVATNTLQTIEHYLYVHRREEEASLKREMANSLRDLFGDPCFNLDEDIVCPWFAPTARVLAQAIYAYPGVFTDRERFLILADSLEEAGCQDVLCVACNGKGVRADQPSHVNSIYGLVPSICGVCHGTRLVRHPLLAHLRLRDRHYRGCWVIDLIIGQYACWSHG